MKRNFVNINPEHSDVFSIWCSTYAPGEGKPNDFKFEDANDLLEAYMVVGEVLSNPYSYGDEGELVCVTIYDGEEVVFQRELD